MTRTSAADETPVQPRLVATVHTRRAVWGRIFSRTAQIGVLTCCLVVALAPVLLMWMSAFKTPQEIATAPLALPTSLKPDNLFQAWTVGRFGEYVKNSIIVTIPVVLGVVTLASMAGYGFARHRFWASAKVVVATWYRHPNDSATASASRRWRSASS